jgi:cell division protein FtsL
MEQKNKDSDKPLELINNNENEKILYITGIIIFCIIVLWIIIIIFTKDNSINILGEMSKPETQISLAL